MTYNELHKILDDENKTITLAEFRKILYKMKTDTFYEQTKYIDVCENKYQWYLGEANGFQLALDLSEHIESQKQQIANSIINDIETLKKIALENDELMPFCKVLDDLVLNIIKAKYQNKNND